jgi:pimeloyl-ACP methyl ester carboxylesterase
MEPVIKYARTSDGVNIAHYAIGEGHSLVCVAPGSNLQHEWRYEEQRLWLEELALHHRVIRFDIRGAGLPDRVPVFEPDVATLDLEAVARSEGLKRFALFGLISAAAITVLYAYRYPQRVSHLNPQILRLRDSYLDVFSDLAPHAELVEALELACRVGKIARALTWNRALTTPGGEDIDEEWARPARDAGLSSRSLLPRWLVSQCVFLSDSRPHDEAGFAALPLLTGGQRGNGWRAAIFRGIPGESWMSFRLMSGWRCTAPSPALSGSTRATSGNATVSFRRNG